MIDPFEYPDEVLWELSDPNIDYDLIEESAYHSRQIGIYENTDGSVNDYGDKKNKTAYHEELKSYQKHLAESFKESAPSKATHVYWIYAESTKKYKKSTPNSGKWLLFLKPEFIDAAWEQVKDATEQGLLGGQSKVSTKKGFKGSDFVICVYSYNWKDEKDVMRIRQELRELGFEKPIPYKTDADTLAGKYSSKGHKGISKYYE